MDAMRALLFLLTGPMACALNAQVPDAPRTFQRGDQVTRVALVDTPSVVHRPGDVIIHQDERIAALMTDFARRKHILKGYRVQIFLGSDRENGSKRIRREFLMKHIDIPAYEDYLAPNFRVRVGDCRTRIEAAHLLQAIKAEYPGAYVVPDEIEMPRLE